VELTHGITGWALAARDRPLPSVLLKATLIQGISWHGLDFARQQDRRGRGQGEDIRLPQPWEHYRTYWVMTRGRNLLSGPWI
jgi:hypothetical protein